MTAHECRKIQCIADERLFGDTFIRAEKLGQFEYVVADIFIYNSNCVYACSTFEQRYEWLKDLLKFIHHVPGTAKFIHKSDLSPKQKLKGYEVHIDDVGKPGYFVDLDSGSSGVDVVKLSIPDCYEVSSGGYLRVPDLKTSEYLRSKGQRFKCQCSKNEDGSWTVLENIP